MFDNLRDLSEGKKPAEEVVSIPTEDYQPKPSGSGRFMGMTAGQRFVIAVLLFFAVVLLGSMCLLVTERILLV